MHQTGGGLHPTARTPTSEGGAGLQARTGDVRGCVECASWVCEQDGVPLTLATPHVVDAHHRIHEHCHMGYLVDVEWFLENGSTVKDVDKVCGQWGVLASLLPHLPLSSTNGQYGRLPLHWAMAGGHIDVIRVLLEKGSPVDVLDSVRGVGGVRSQPTAALVVAHARCGRVTKHRCTKRAPRLTQELLPS